jgi:hypothetical protein
MVDGDGFVLDRQFERPDAAGSHPTAEKRGGAQTAVVGSGTTVETAAAVDGPPLIVAQKAGGT